MLGKVDYKILSTSKPSVLYKNVPQLMRNDLTPIQNVLRFYETQTSTKILHNFGFVIITRKLSNGSKYPDHESS